MHFNYYISLVIFCFIMGNPKSGFREFLQVMD